MKLCIRHMSSSTFNLGLTVSSIRCTYPRLGLQQLLDLLKDEKTKDIKLKIHVLH